MHLRSWILGLALALVPPGLAAAEEGGDEAAIRRLNGDYVRAFVASDAALYRGILADDFRAVLADGQVIDRREFLHRAALPRAVTDCRLEGLWVRIFGDTAVVTGRLAYRHPGGPGVRTFYVDIYVRRAGRWRMVSAQFERVGG